MAKHVDEFSEPTEEVMQEVVSEDIGSSVVTGELVKIDDKPVFIAPAATFEQAKEMIDLKKKLMNELLVEDTDYGTIPGTPKPTLYKAGAEKANSFFGLSPVMKTEASIEDWNGTDHGGEPFFFYKKVCQLWRGDRLIAALSGSCNSWEEKYRYRSTNRKCPKCQKETIIKGKAQYGGGWLCYAKKGGCGAKFVDKDPLIVDQIIGKTANDRIFDEVNTIEKMAEKRALVASTLVATGMSQYFTQDLDDKPGTSDYVDMGDPGDPGDFGVDQTSPQKPAPQKKADKTKPAGAIGILVEVSGLAVSDAVKIANELKLTSKNTKEEITALYAKYKESKKNA